MDLTHGILMFFMGCSITLIGFFIAFLVIRYNLSKEMKKELTEVQKSIRDLKSDEKQYGEDCQ
tara:strand:- start:229 stop:417 length:189 start_codon:yes stop_codon:yes gene_type:complete